jgi:hypothetical protein
MTTNFSKKPVRFIEGNQDLLKAQSGAEPGATDMRITESIPSVASGVQASYRTPIGRDNGNVMFRRMPDGNLDYEYAKHKIVDALHVAKDSGPLNSLQKTALTVLFPALFFYIDTSMVASVREVNLKISAIEAMRLRNMVAAFVKEELNWNAGFGGGSTRGRSSSRS